MPPPAAPPSNNLWIGNLSTDVTESDLQSIFRKYGLIDSITSYASRSYAFIYYKTVDDAKAAKEALQGHVIRGDPIRIEFAKLAKPCKSLWVAGISPSFSKEELEAEFQKFGKIQEFKFLKDRNTAYVDYFRLEDASQALRSMNGKRIGGDVIRVDFLRSQPARREPWSDSREAREGQFSGRGFTSPDAHWMSPDVMRNYSEPVHAGSKRHMLVHLGMCKGDRQPSNILWISYPPTVHIDEDMLHNAMILFGEIERIKTFPDRNYSFVEFRSVDEARLAKEGLEGKLFNDPRIMIDYSNSDFGPGKEVGYYPGIKGPRPDAYFDEDPFGSRQLEMLAPNRPMLQNNVPPHIHGRGARGCDMVMRPLDSNSSVDHGFSTSDLSELNAFRNFPENSPKGLHGASDWRMSSPAGSRTNSKSGSSGWDVFDASQVQRQSKRSRIGTGMDEQYEFGILSRGGASGSLANLRANNRFSPVEARGLTGGIQQKHSDEHIWRGLIAKGGTPVCQARCVPFREEGVEFDIPEVVNCSARTGLDMLAKHYADAVGFNIVFFLPDSEEDFASYTEFLRYLGSKNRAGVAKCDDGTTLFLVPPSDFLTDVLNVVGPERLYGVVLKFRSHTPSDSSSMHPNSLASHDADKKYIASSQTGHNVISQERISHNSYERVPHEDTNSSRTLGPLVTNSLHGNSAPPVSSTVMQKTGLTLTPELIATLASLLPANNKSSSSENVLQPSASLTMASSLAIDKGLPQGWKQEHHTQQLTGHMVQPSSNQYNPQGQYVPQVPAYPLDSNTANYSVQGLIGGSQTQDGTFSLHPQLPVSSKSFPSSSYLQSGQVVYPHQVDQQYQQVVPQDALKVHKVAHGSDASPYGSAGQVQYTNSITLPNQAHGAHVPQGQPAMQLALQVAVANQAHQHNYGQNPLQPGQAASDGEVDKNERYRTTLLFAADLLKKIQQQPGSHNGQGSGSH